MDEVRDKRPRGWSWFDNCLIDHYAALIGPYALAVYMSLSRHSDNDDQSCYPSHEAMAKELRLSRATVKRAVAVLKQHGLIRSKRRLTASGDPDSNVYYLLQPWGGVRQTLPNNTPDTIMVSVNDKVGSNRPEGGVTQTLGVGSIRATNKTQYEQDLKTTTPPSPSSEEDHQKSFVSAKKSTRIPENWQPTESDLEWARENGYDKLVDLDLLTEEFCKYWQSRGAGATKLNWSKAWQVRMIDQVKRLPSYRHNLASRTRKLVE